MVYLQLFSSLQLIIFCEWMFLYLLVEDIKNNLKLFNNTHVFEPNIWRNTSRGGGECKLSKIYDSLLESPSSSSRTPQPVSSGSGSVSCNSATIHWGQRRVSPKYLVQKRGCCWTVLNYFWWLFFVFCTMCQQFTGGIAWSKKYIFCKYAIYHRCNK